MTARDFAQTLALCERFGIEHTAIGRHRGGRLAAKALGLVAALAARSCAGRAAAARFDLALGHGSNDVTVAAALLRIPVRRRRSTTSGRPSSTPSTAGSRRRVVVPEAIPPERLAPLRRDAASSTRYPGLKEEYYLADFEPDPAVLDELGLDRGAADRRRAHAAGGLALPPLRERHCSARVLERAARERRAGGRAAAHARAARRAGARPAASSSPSARSTRSR